jgi:hypothetical protein
MWDFGLQIYAGSKIIVMEQDDNDLSQGLLGSSLESIENKEVSDRSGCELIGSLPF